MPFQIKDKIQTNIKINLLLLAGSIIFLLFVESLLYLLNIPEKRLRYDIALPFIIENDHRGYDWRGYHTFRDELFELDKVILTDPDRSVFWVPRSGIYPFNSEGTIGDKKDERCTNKRCARILALGDSNTLWDGESAYPFIFQSEAARSIEPFCEIRLINAGVHGYSTYQGLNYLKRFIGYKPDIITISFGWNDTVPVRAPEDKYYGKALYNLIQKKEFLLYDLMHKSRIVQIMEKGIIFAMTIFVEPETRHRVYPEDFRENLIKMIQISKEIGAIPVLITRPHYFRENKIHQFEYDVDKYNDIVRKISEEEKIILFDMSLKMKKYKISGIFSDYSHLNEYGQQVAGRLLFERIKDKMMRICSENEK